MLENDPDVDGYDEPEPNLDNDESQNKDLEDRYGSATDATS